MAAAYGGLNVYRYSNEQASSGMVLSPQFSYFAEQFTLSAKLDLVWAGIDNKHSEDVTNGTDSGSITQSLKEKGTLSWAFKPHLRYMLDNESSVVVRGSYAKLGINTEHRLKGSFAGSGLSALQLAGYDYADGTQDVAVDQWEAVLGYLKGWDKGKHLVVLGAGVKGENAKVLGSTYQTRTGAATLNDVVPLRKLDAAVNRMEIPVFMGAEISVAPWAKARGMVSRNFFDFSDTKLVDEGYAATGVLASRKTTKLADDTPPAPSWIVAMGFGLDFGSFNWDTAVNMGLLGSATGAAFVNPLYQSSFTYGF